MNAFIFISTERGQYWKIMGRVRNIEGVKIAHAVTGEHDIIAYAEFIYIPELGRIIDSIQQIEGVAKTTTSITMAPRLNDSPS